MRKIILLLFILITGLTVFGQGASASANAGATIVTPISIVANDDMNFGNVASSSSAGTVELAANGSRLATGGTTLPAITGIVTAAKFTITGEVGYVWQLTSITATVTLDDGVNPTMDIDTWVFDCTSGTYTLSAGAGTDELFVGATLHVGVSQGAGVYTSTSPIVVTVDYN
jgi:hypothetical protein